MGGLTNHEPSGLKTLADALNTSWQTNFGAKLNNGWKVTSVAAQSLGGDGAQGINNTGFTFTNSSSGLPPGAAICLSWLSNATWRGGRPRTYLPGIVQNDLAAVNGSALASGVPASFASAGNAVLTTMNAVTDAGNSFTMGFPSYYTNYTLRPVPVFYPLGSAIVHSRLDSQRRRNGKERYFP